MPGLIRLITLLAAVAGVTLLTVGVTYLVVECQALPGLLGPTPGDTSPRTGLGIAGLVLGSAALGLALALRRRRPPGASRRS